MSGGIPYPQVIHDCIELSIYSEGAFTYQEAINMGVDETPYLIYTFKKHYESKEKHKQELKKAEYEYKNKAVDSILKA